MRTRDERYSGIRGDELFRRLATGESLFVLDVRTASEFERGHIAESVLMPLHELESAWATVPNHGMPIAIVCEQGYRSLAACRFLAERGYGPLYNLEGGLEAWPGPLTTGGNGDSNPQNLIAPSRWLVDHFPLLPRGVALDVAMGNGRNAVYLSARGFDVDGVDVNSTIVDLARTRARRLGAPIRAVVGNVEDGSYIIPIDAYDVIVVFNFLHRPLFKEIRDGVRPGGVVVYQTFTTDQARFGPPRDPSHLLRPGELSDVFADWEILESRERVEAAGPGNPPRALAGIVARRPKSS